MRVLKILLTSALLLLPLSPQAAQAREWRLGTWKTAQTCQPFFYARHAPGTEVKVYPFTNPADQKSALLAGSLDMCGTTLVTAIQAAAAGEPVTVVAAMGNKCSALVVKKDGGVSEVAQLKGGRVAYVPGTMHEILLREALHKAGLDPRRDVSLVRVDFFDMGTALIKGDVEAFLSGEPLPTQAQMQGYGRILSYPYFDDGIGAINSAMLVRAETVEKEPELLLAMLRAHKLATEELAADRKFWLDESARLFGVSRPVLEASADNMELAWDMDDAFVRRVRALGARMKELGMIRQEPDYDRLIDRRFIRALHEE